MLGACLAPDDQLSAVTEADTQDLGRASQASFQPASCFVLHTRSTDWTASATAPSLRPSHAGTAAVTLAITWAYERNFR